MRFIILRERLEKRGPSYREELRPAILEETAEKLTIDGDHAAWKSYLEKIPQPPQPVASGPSEPPKPLPVARWPYWAKALAEKRQPGEIGPGDTMKRILGEPGNWYEEMRKKIGFPCRCAERREEWNRRYPYYLCTEIVASSTT